MKINEIEESIRITGGAWTKMTPDKLRAKSLLDAAPDLTDEDRKEVNGIFAAYIFRVRRTREVWTTCCGVHDVLPADSPLLDAPHKAQTSSFMGCASQYPLREARPDPEPVNCPFCGKSASVKELGRTGLRGNLESCKRAVILKQRGGALWGISLYAYKDYADPERLTELPDLYPNNVYKFEPGYAARANKYGAFQELRGEKLKRDFSFREPFGYNWEDGLRYFIFGPEQLSASHLRWCRLEDYINTETRFTRLLAVSCFYPRQVEMLTKAGLNGFVTDFVNRKKRNAAVMDWENPNPLQSFGLTKPELREFLTGKKEPAILAYYKRVRKAGIPMSFTELNNLKERAGDVWIERIVNKMAKYRLNWIRLRNYLEKEIEAASGEKKPAMAFMCGLWSDYIDAAVTLEYDLKNDVYLMPKNLPECHDRATETASRIAELRKKAESDRKFRTRAQKLAKRYTYSDGRWLIRPPVSADEIVAEGKALGHCVGGYAARHADGQTTILFLRDRKRPGVPLVTIEMRGNSIAQIHGYRNELAACPENPDRKSPKEIYGAFLNGWLAWLKSGSRRDRKGRPVIPRRKPERVIVTPTLAPV